VSASQGPGVGTTGALDEVTELVSRWRGARGPMDQVRAVASGTRTLGAMSPDERRVLAQAVAERGSPEIAARLLPEGSGQSRSELTELTRALLSVDRTELDRIAASLEDPGERRRLLVEATEAVADAGPPPPTGPPIALPPPPQAPASPGEEDGPPPRTEPAVQEPAQVAPVPEVPEAVPEVPETAPVPEAPPVGEVLDALRRATSARERLSAVARLEGAPLSGDDLDAVVRSLPDGWQRRTAATRLLAAGDVTHLDPVGTVGAFARDSDRIAVAGVLVDAGLAEADTVAAALPDRAAARLRRRAAR
jgi:hypothetical protein